MVEARPDHAEGHGPHGGVEHEVLAAALGLPPAFGDDDPEDDAGHDAQRVGAQRDRAQVPDADRGAGQGGGQGGGDHGATVAAVTARCSAPAGSAPRSSSAGIARFSPPGGVTVTVGVPLTSLARMESATARTWSR